MPSTFRRPPGPLRRRRRSSVHLPARPDLFVIPCHPRFCRTIQLQDFHFTSLSQAAARSPDLIKLADGFLQARLRRHPACPDHAMPRTRV